MRLVSGIHVPKDWEGLICTPSTASFVLWFIDYEFQKLAILSAWPGLNFTIFFFGSYWIKRYGIGQIPRIFKAFFSLKPYPWILDKKIQILGIELASFLDKKSNKNFRDLILGFEMASFLDKKSRPFFFHIWYVIIV